MNKLVKLIPTVLLASSLLHVSAYAKEEKSPVFENDAVFKDFQKLQEDMNKIFEKFNKDFFNIPKSDMFFDDYTFSAPKADLKDAGNHYEIKVNLPGSKDADIKVKVKDKILNIDASAQTLKEDKSDKYIKKERFAGAVHRSLTLPDDADADKLKTDLKDGVLTVTIPKK